MTPSVAFFMPTLRGGGAERNTLRLATGFLERGYVVTIVVADSRGQYHFLIPDGATFTSLGVRFLPASVLALTRWLRRAKPDVVISVINGANVVALAARRLSRLDLPVVVSERNTLSYWRRDLPSLQRRWLIPWLMRLLYPQADVITAVSRETADDLARWLRVPRHTVRKIASPVMDRQILRLADAPLPAPWHERLDGSPLVVAVGRLVAQKDPLTLLRAFASVANSNGDVRLAFLGEGPLERPLMRLRDRLGLHDRVWFPGFQQNPYAWMRQAQVLALTSRYEGLPTVLIEGLACGARVVATDAPGGTREILEDGLWGALPPVGDVRAIASALAEQLSVGRWPDTPTEALKRFAIDHIVDEYLRLLRPLVSDGIESRS